MPSRVGIWVRLSRKGSWRATRPGMGGVMDVGIVRARARPYGLPGDPDDVAAEP